MENPYRLSVKIGQHEFSCEGTEAAVRSDFEKFIAGIQSLDNRPTSSALSIPWFGASSRLASDAGSSSENRQAANQKEMEAAAYLAHQGLSPEECAEIFEFDKDQENAVILKKRPRTIAECLILLLLGYEMLTREPANAADLRLSASLSRFAYDRFDIAIGPFRRFLIIDGKTRGMRYSLNARGKWRATGIARQLLIGEP